MADAIDDFLTGKTTGGSAASVAPSAAAPQDATDAYLTGADATTTAARVASSEPELFRPETWRVPQDPAAQRIRDVAYQAFISAPSRGEAPGNMSVLSPEAQGWTDRNLGPLIGAVPRLAGTVVGGVAAAGAAAGQTVNELLAGSGMDPGLQRDLNMAAMVAPVAMGANALTYRPRLEPAGPRYAGGVTPGGLEEAAARERVRTAFGPAPGEAPPSSPTGIEGPRPPPPGYVPAPPVSPSGPGGGTATTSAEAKQVASQYYNLADRSGGTLTPQFTNKFIDSVTTKLPQTEAGQVIGGQSEVASLVDRLQSLRDKPMTLQAAQEADEALGNLIDKEWGVKGLSKEGKNLADIQRSFRDQISNAEPGDITGGAAGFDALVQARKAWSQAMKMDDLERIQRRAEMTDNPATSFKTQIRTLLTNVSKSRGYDAEETAALERASERGLLGSALHVFGSRLVPLAAGAVGAASGPFHALAAAGAMHAGSTAMRNMASSLAASRLNNALTILGKNVPPSPLTPP